MYKIKKNIFLVVFLLPTLFFGQENISEIVQPSSSANSTENSLYFIDFWATWCGPCIHVSKYLSVLQKKHPNRFYIVSLTQESPGIIDRFFKKHQTDLAVAIDYNGETFRKYNIQSLPQGVLLNAKGDVIWEGHPADLKSIDVNRFLKQNSKTTSLNKMFKQNNEQMFLVKDDVYKPTANIEFVETESATFTDVQLSYLEGGYKQVSGTLQNILAYFLKVNKSQVVVDKNMNKSYTLYYKNSIVKNSEDLLKTVLNVFELNVVESSVKGDVIVLAAENLSLWDVNQINWGEQGQPYLIDDSQIQADNASVLDVTYKLSSVLETPIILKGDFDYSKLYDWQIHYKYFKLMQTDLLDNYGIKVEMQQNNYPSYKVIKKAPK